MRNHIPHWQIAFYVSKGYDVRSVAAGRCGKVVRVINGTDDVKIRTFAGRTGVTRFDQGDPVKMVVDKTQRTARIENR